MLAVSQGLLFTKLAYCVPAVEHGTYLLALTGARAWPCGVKVSFPCHWQAAEERNGGTGIYSKLAHSKRIHKLGWHSICLGSSFPPLPSTLFSFLLFLFFPETFPGAGRR